MSLFRLSSILLKFWLLMAKQMSSAYMNFLEIVSGRLFVKILKRVGARTEP
jgi:hypothetical protein